MRCIHTWKNRLGVSLGDGYVWHLYTCGKCPVLRSVTYHGDRTKHVRYHAERARLEWPPGG